MLSHETLVRDARLPAERFVPPHIHPAQDAWSVVLDGNLQTEFLGYVHKSGPGDTVRMPTGHARRFFNRSGTTAHCAFGVAPARKLFAFFVQLDGVTDPETLVRLSSLHEVDFLPRPYAA